MRDREQQIAEALADYLDRQARGEPANLEDFCRRYPELEPELRPQLEALTRMDASTAAPTSEPLPERLSGHKILSELGSGGMGRVYLAYDERLGRKVAIKTLNHRLRDLPGLRSRFLQEARTMARLVHPNIARIYDLGPPEEPPHFVMEYIEGAPLTEAARPLSVEQKAELMRKVLLAVDFQHRNELVHRDLKPANILVGADLDPKLLDFGLALRLDDSGQRLTLAGEVLGTPRYLSPEQARGEARLDARSDVFTLGTILYELLTGVLPFRGENFAQQVRSISEQDPSLPRRINPQVPGELQNICLKALEKNPADRYQSALEMAQDIERFLAGEPVLAAPGAYSRLMAGKIEEHLRELEGWRRDEIVSAAEHDSLRRGYERLMEREDAWILEARRLTLPQVSLYLGGWILVTGAALLVLFRYTGLSGAAAVLASAAAAAPACYAGIWCWRRRRLRIGVAWLLAFCLLLPITLLVAMGEFRWFTGFTRSNEGLELFSKLPSFKRITNAQLWWALLVSLPGYYWLRRFTRSPVFSLVLAVMTALFWLATMLRMGVIEWFSTDPGRVYYRLIPAAVGFFLAGFTIERLRHPGDSRYFYPIGVTFTLIAFSGVAAFHEPYAEALRGLAPWTHGHLEYLFMLNALLYLAFQSFCERFGSPQLRSAGRAFRFVIPGHVLTSLLLLGLEATRRWTAEPASAALRLEARLFEILLPIAACVFVFGSIPKQMKNFFATGLLFLAIGIVRLQQELFRNRGLWPMCLLLLGLVLMFVAANYSAIKLRLSRLR